VTHTRLVPSAVTTMSFALDVQVGRDPGPSGAIVVPIALSHLGSSLRRRYCLASGLCQGPAWLPFRLFGTASLGSQATSTIPIVFAIADDPVGRGLVANLAHPRDNVTGLSLQTAETAGKRLELLREVVPQLRQLAIMGHSDNPQSMREISDVEDSARRFSLEPSLLKIRQGDDVGPALDLRSPRGCQPCSTTEIDRRALAASTSMARAMWRS